MINYTHIGKKAGACQSAIMRQETKKESRPAPQSVNLCKKVVSVFPNTITGSSGCKYDYFRVALVVVVISTQYLSSQSQCSQSTGNLPFKHHHCNPLIVPK
jgi:hypothetical protein